MTDQALADPGVFDGSGAATADTHAHTPDSHIPKSHIPESPWIVFPGLVLLLIMPLGIVFHPDWLAGLAEFGTFVMFCVIFRLTRL